MIHIERTKLLCVALGCVLLLSLAPGLPVSATWLLTAATPGEPAKVSDRIASRTEEYRLLNSAPFSLPDTSAPSIQPSLTVTDTAALLVTSRLPLDFSGSDVFLPVIVR